MAGRRPVRRFLIIAGGSALISAILVGVWVESMIRARWSGMAQRVDALRGEIAGLTSSRTVLRGTAIPGNGWEEYEQAAIAEVRDDIPSLNEILGGHDKDSGRADELLRKYESGALHLRKGVRRQTVLLPGPSVRIPDLTLAILKLRARDLRRNGQSPVAAELLLDIAQVGLDIGRNRDDSAQRAAHEVFVFMSDELRELLVSDRATPEAFAEIGRQLETLDRNWIRWGSTFLHRTLAMGLAFLSDDLDGYEALPERAKIPFRDARHLYSRRLMLVDAFEQWDRWNRRLSEGDGMSRAQFAGLLQEIEGEAAASRNEVLRALLDRWPGCFKIFASDFNRERRAQLRLLRTIAHYRATGEVLTLEDPFGGSLRSRREGDQLRTWSIGANGRDDGGVGVWEPRPAGTAVPAPDIVVEVRR